MSKFLLVTFFAVLSMSTLSQADEVKLIGKTPRLETLDDLVSMGIAQKSGPDREFLSTRGYQLYEITSEVRSADICTFKLKLKKENPAQVVNIEYFFFMSYLKSKYSDSTLLIDMCLNPN